MPTPVKAMIIVKILPKLFPDRSIISEYPIVEIVITVIYRQSSIEYSGSNVPAITQYTAVAPNTTMRSAVPAKRNFFRSFEVIFSVIWANSRMVISS